MKWWVGLLALLLLVLFASLGTLYVRTFVVHRAHGVILFVADGLDVSLLNQARHQAAARGQKMNIDSLDQLCVLDVEGLDEPVPDEAAASTALACGRRVRNGLVSVTAEEKNLTSLVYAAQRAGRATGLVTTRDLTAPTPLAFYGRTPGQPGYELRSAAELVDTSGMEVILGGGSRYFTPANVLNEWGRTDGRDLAADAARNGYTVVTQARDLNQIATWRTGRLLGLFAPGDFAFSALRRGSSTEPSLEDMTRMAVKCLQYNIGGYLLVVDHGLIGAAARRNLTGLALDEVAALDAAIGTARAYAGNNSLVLVTNSFSLGALDPTQSAATAAGPGALGTRYGGTQWLSGPGGPPETDDDRRWLKEQTALGLLSPDPASPLHPGPAVRFSRRAEVTGAPAWVGAGGFDSERFSGFLGNDQLFALIQGLF